MGGLSAPFGRASFCLYLLHFNLWNILQTNQIAAHLHLAWAEPWFSYAAILIVAYLAFALVEKPVQSWLLTRYVYKTNPPRQATTPLG